MSKSTMSNTVPFKPTDKLIAIDIDGVLNSHKFIGDHQCSMIDPSCVHRLNRILMDTGAKMVLSSAWRYMIAEGAMTVRGFDHLLASHGVIRQRLIGYTPSDETTPDRGWQIQAWLDDHNWQGNYVVIDDNDLEISRLHPMVLTDHTKGLTDEDVERAILILNR